MDFVLKQGIAACEWKNKTNRIKQPYARMGRTARPANKTGGDETPLAAERGVKRTKA